MEKTPQTRAQNVDYSGEKALSGFSRRLSSFFAQLANSGFYQFAGRFWDYECRKSSRKIDISRASDSSAATSEAILLQAYITVA